MGVSTFAQQDSTSTKGNEKNIIHNAGFNLGSTTGIGPSYRLQKGIFKYQVAFLPISSYSDYWINYGFMFGVDLHKTETTSFFAYSGVSMLHTKSENYFGSFYDVQNNNYMEDYYTEYNNDINVGLGAGIERVYSNNISVNLMFGYGVYMGEKKLPRLTVSGEIGLFYRFNR